MQKEEKEEWKLFIQATMIQCMQPLQQNFLELQTAVNGSDANPELGLVSRSAEHHDLLTKLSTIICDPDSGLAIKAKNNAEEIKTLNKWKSWINGAIRVWIFVAAFGGGLIGWFAKDVYERVTILEVNQNRVLQAHKGLIEPYEGRK